MSRFLRYKHKQVVYPTCSSCHRGRNGMEFVRVPWVYVHSDKTAGLLPQEEWEYYCEPCRTLQILGGDDRPMYNLEDF